MAAPTRVSFNQAAVRSSKVGGSILGRKSGPRSVAPDRCQDRWASPRLSLRLRLQQGSYAKCPAHQGGASEGDVTESGTGEMTFPPWRIILPVPWHLPNSLIFVPKPGTTGWFSTSGGLPTDCRSSRTQAIRRSGAAPACRPLRLRSWQKSLRFWRWCSTRHSGCHGDNWSGYSADQWCCAHAGPG